MVLIAAGMLLTYHASFREGGFRILDRGNNLLEASGSERGNQGDHGSECMLSDEWTIRNFSFGKQVSPFFSRFFKTV